MKSPSSATAVRATLPRVVTPIRERLQADLPAALKARDALRVSVLRATLAAVGNAEAVAPSELQEAAGLLADVARKALSEGDVRAIVGRERDDLLASAQEMVRLGRPEAQGLRAQADILGAYLAT